MGKDHDDAKVFSIATRVFQSNVEVFCRGINFFWLGGGVIDDEFYNQFDLFTLSVFLVLMTCGRQVGLLGDPSVLSYRYKG